MGRSMLNKSLIQFSVDGWGCVPSLLFDLRPNYGGGDEHNGNFFQKYGGCALLKQPEEIPHIQGKRNPSKTVGVARGHQRADTLK